MNDKHKLRWSDIWLLISIYLASLKNEHQLKNIIGAADAINHAVINFEELSSGLVRLSEHGLITVNSNLWNCACTNQAIQIIEPIAKKNSLSFSLWKEAEKVLDVEPWVPKESLPHPENSLLYPGFTKEIYNKEVSAYLKRIHLIIK